MAAPTLSTSSRRPSRDCCSCAPARKSPRCEGLLCNFGFLICDFLIEEQVRLPCVCLSIKSQIKNQKLNIESSMDLTNIHHGTVRRTRKKRVGRGPGSGHGKTSTRGSKGQWTSAGAKKP